MYTSLNLWTTVFFAADGRHFTENWKSKAGTVYYYRAIWFTTWAL